MHEDSPEPRPRRGLSIPEACEILGVSRATIYRRINDGSVRVVRLGGRVIVPSTEIDRILSPEAAE